MLLEAINNLKDESLWVTQGVMGLIQVEKITFFLEVKWERGAEEPGKRVNTHVEGVRLINDSFPS